MIFEIVFWTACYFLAGYLALVLTGIEELLSRRSDEAWITGLLFWPILFVFMVGAMIYFAVEYAWQLSRKK